MAELWSSLEAPALHGDPTAAGTLSSVSSETLAFLTAEAAPLTLDADARRALGGGYAAVASSNSAPPANVPALLAPAQVVPALVAPALIAPALGPPMSSDPDAPPGAPPITKGRWTLEEHEDFLRLYAIHPKGWKSISTAMKTRTVVQVKTHAQKHFRKPQIHFRHLGGGIGGGIVAGAAAGQGLDTGAAGGSGGKRARRGGDGGGGGGDGGGKKQRAGLGSFVPGMPTGMGMGMPMGLGSLGMGMGMGMGMPGALPSFAGIPGLAGLAQHPGHMAALAIQRYLSQQQPLPPVNVRLG